MSVFILIDIFNYNYNSLRYDSVLFLFFTIYFRLDLLDIIWENSVLENNMELKKNNYE